MYWFQVGCCGYILALASFSEALNADLQVSQKPRFYGVKTSRNVVIHCSCRDHSLPVQWYKASRYNMAPAERGQVLTGQRVSIMGRTPNRAASITLQNVDIEDSGVYFCQMNNTWGPGTELQVFRPINIDNAVYRSKMKDGLIFIQGLMLAMCIAAALIHNHLLVKKQEAIYEEPEIDHIYEGLAIETCGGDIYQDISVYTEPEGAEAPWERD